MKLKSRYYTTTLQELWNTAREEMSLPANHLTKEDWIRDLAYDRWCDEHPEEYYVDEDAVDEMIEGQSYTLFDDIQRRFFNTVVGQFVSTLYHFYTDKPDYTGLIYS